MDIKKAGLVIVGVLLVGLFLFNRSDVSLTKQDAFTITPIGANGYELHSTLHFYNPNLLSSTIKEISENFYINGRSIAIMKMEIAQGIPGRKETSFPVTVRFNRNDLKQLFPDSAVGLVKGEVSVTGEITFSNMFGGGKISVEQNDSLTIPGL
ncbi:MAG TPA: LEA type 2 family protein [Chitinophagales bacterium]|nr:LEA type 2 family protein [Chitinophagales bacterium]